MRERSELQTPTELKGHLEEAEKIYDWKLNPERGGIATSLELGFLDFDLSREGAAMVAAMGTRDPVRYSDIAKRISDNKASSFLEVFSLISPEDIQKAGGKLGKISHDSISEMALVGNNPHGGDRPLYVEGISAASLLDVIGRGRYISLEIYSSRAGVLSNLADPKELKAYPELRTEFNDGMRETMQIYKQLTILTIAHFLRATPKAENEKKYEYWQRVLSTSLDYSRRITPMACLIHGAITFPNALAAQKEITKIWSEFPQTEELNEFCERALNLFGQGTPTILRYTGPREGMIKQQEFQREIGQNLRLSKTEGTGITYLNLDEESLNFLAAAIVAKYNESTFQEIVRWIKSDGREKRNVIIDKFLGQLNPYDLPPEELGFLTAQVEYSIDVGGGMDFVRHRPIKKVGAMMTKDLGHFTDPFWRDVLGKEAHDLYERSFEICYKIWKKLIDAGLPGVARNAIQRGDYMRIRTSETGLDMWRLHALRTDIGTDPILRKAMRAKHDYLTEKYPYIFSHFPVTYR